MVGIVLGVQWGDEGKARVIDYFAKDYEYVVRFQGGANAGHTVYHEGEKFVFHMVPSGILNKNAKVVISNGVVVDIDELVKELEQISGIVDVKNRVFLSNKAHIVMPYHKLMDKAKEKGRANDKEEGIGTTLRGIGPAYVDKYDRVGIRLGDLLLPDNKSHLLHLIEKAYEMKKYLLTNYYGMDSLPSDIEMLESLLANLDKIKGYITNTEKLLQDAYKDGKNILFEGAQGTLLDVDFGTYPFVTSSNTVSSGALNGSGIGAVNVDSVVGIIKAYTTRVGKGPFPTELEDEYGQKLRDAGSEYGATTGRSRRCGWFDAVICNYSIGVNNVSSLFLTKLDVLDGMDKIKIASSYMLDGSEITYPPFSSEELARVKPKYIELDGWNEKIFGINSYEKLPKNAKKYIDKIEETLNTKIGYISTGYNRENLIVR